MEWGRGGVLRSDGYELYFEYDPKLYYPACVKKADAEFLKEQNDYQEEQRRRIKVAKEKRELERVERWKKLEAKWTAEDKLFLIKYGITREEAINGKVPKFNHVGCVIPDPPIDVMHVDNVQFEAKNVAVQFVDVVYDRGEDKHVATPFVLEQLSEVVQPKISIDILVDDATKLETLVEVPDDHRSELGDETVDKAEKGSDFHSFGACLSPIFRVDDLYIVDGGGKPKHTLDDPYLVHVDVSHYLCLYGYLATFHGSIDIYIEPPDRYYVPLVKPGAATSYAVGTELFIRILFDPGISLEFILGSSDVVHDGALFYDILLIRGRILSNREGMI